MSDLNLKLYCGLLGIKFEEFSSLTRDEQLEMIKSMDGEMIQKSSYKLLSETKDAMIKLLEKLKEEEKEEDRHIKYLEKITRDNHNKAKNNGWNLDNNDNER